MFSGDLGNWLEIILNRSRNFSNEGNVFLLLTLLLTMAFFCYICVPILTFVNAVRKLWKGDEWDENKDVVGFSYTRAPFMKLFECVGEAVPQLILAVVYATNNYPYLLEHEDYLGIGIPVTIISCIFSAGSIVMGMISAIKAWNS